MPWSDIVWLGEPGCDDRRLVGGKVAHLSRLIATQRIPLGFCVTARALERAMIESDPGDRSGPGRLRWSGAIASALSEAYGSLGARLGQSEPRVAIRSSAVDEDGAVASFAGQYETYLNIVGAKAVAAAVRRCWDSLWIDRAQEYRRQHGLAHRGPRLAVLVQHLVVADVSAVVFSANPVTGNRVEIVVNASWGLGESIVGGSVTPDAYVVSKSNLSVQTRTIGEKRRMTIPITGGTREVDVPRLLRERPSLDDETVLALARLARDLEEYWGWPVDLECALRDGELYLLQCRPVTTLAPRRGEESGRPRDFSRPALGLSGDLRGNIP